ncbi:TM2 domain-containing protein 3 [Fasciola hepatica]|uniref:TM2 domain-containing protein 3 n=1 Tax=Fasciola hepatica TaxID=6192 RepID=A0A4E0RHV9_FASHE|nr:TM2 domain-containing protein 3 [Fasciola hepatica]
MAMSAHLVTVRFRIRLLEIAVLLVVSCVVPSTADDELIRSTSATLEQLRTNVTRAAVPGAAENNDSVLLNVKIPRVHLLCPPMLFTCFDLPSHCLKCDFDHSCWYGALVNVTCRPADGVFCKATPNTTETHVKEYWTILHSQNRTALHTNYTMQKQFICRFCHQIADTEMTCIGRTHCRQPEVPRSFYETLCEPKPDVLCMGRRVFRRMLPCNWSNGKRYVTTVLLSLFLGGLGVDRFYLGMWMEGLGKLLSFGGLGVWSVVDFILILAGYVKPPGDAVYV